MELAENNLSAILAEHDVDIWPNGAIMALRLGKKNSDRYGRQAVIAFQVAVSQCCQLGIHMNDAEFVKWVYTAAKGSHHNALWMAPLLEDSTNSTYGDLDFRKACLVIGSCIGSAPSLAALEQEDRALYELTRAAIRSRQRQDFSAQIGRASCRERV